MFTFIKTKNGRKLSSKRNVQNLAITSSRHKMARYIEEIDTDCDLSNLKKHLLRYLMDETDNVGDENQVNNEKLEIKSKNQPFPKTAVKITRYGRVVKPTRRYDKYESH